ncbi:MAG: ATP-binding protein [Gemmatimonadales bacterium]
MTEGTGESRDMRVLLLAPTSRDASFTSSILERAGMACVGCSSVTHICRELEIGAGAVVLPEEAVVPERESCLIRWLARQPAWSDLPVLILARPGADSTAVAQAMDLLGNVTVLERPMRVSALVSAARSALRARQRQYQIREHIVEHEQAAEALRDSDRRKDDFLAILAHELRNPLAPIRNSLQILRMTVPQDPSAERIIGVMDRQINLMVRLVDDLMEVSRISRGKIELRKEPADVGAIVRGAIDVSRPLIEAGAHRLAVFLPDEPVTLEGDVVRLTQVVANLLNNAAKYSDDGGQITLTVEREEHDEQGVAISVRDTGHGIPPDMLPFVFDPFLQVRQSEGRAQGGLGIGLTLAKHLVELHGGSVEARSGGPGRGSEFVVRLPLGGTRRSSDVPSAEERSPASLPPRRILVVDDNRDAAESLGTLLELLGADVCVAYSGVEALEAFSTYEPAVVLLDIGMPDMDGHEVARRIRQEPGARKVTLIALTGWGQEQDRRRSESAGFDYHLVKPADLQVLESLLSSLRADR